jgi:hypothetical protein
MTDRLDHDPFRVKGSSSPEGGEPPGLLPESQCPPPHRYWHAALTTGAEALTPDERQHLAACDRCREHLGHLTRAVHFPSPEEAAALEEELFGQDDQATDAALFACEDAAEALPPPGRPHCLRRLDPGLGGAVAECRFFFEQDLTALLQLRDGRHWLRLEQPELPAGTPLLIALERGSGQWALGWVRVVLLHAGPAGAFAQLQVEEALPAAGGEHALTVQTLPPEQALASGTVAMWRQSFAQACVDDPAALPVWRSWVTEQMYDRSEPEVRQLLRDILSRRPTTIVAAASTALRKAACALWRVSAARRRSTP